MIVEPPENFAGLNLKAWPTLTEQIEYVEKSLAQVERAIDNLVGGQSLLDDLEREQAKLTAVLHTLKAVVND